MIRIEECAYVDCDGKDIEQSEETTLVAYFTGVDQNRLTISCLCKKCNRRFSFEGVFKNELDHS